MFAAGAERVMPLTFRSLSYTSPEQVEELDDIVRTTPTSGSTPPTRRAATRSAATPTKGVVDERFRLPRAENVYVCDASVFPSSVTVNPQLTVMALADYASSGID